MSPIELKAQKRNVTGKKVNDLRKQSITPAHLFGPKIESEAIQIDTSSLKRVLVEAGHTKLINLQVGREKNPRTVMVREVQIDAIKGNLLHVDLYQVQLTETIRVNVPVILVGEAAAAKAKGNSLVQELNELTVQALPANIPSLVEVDITPLVSADDLIRVKDIKPGKDFTIVNEPGVVVARIATEVAEAPIGRPKAEEAAATAEETESEEKEQPAEKS